MSALSGAVTVALALITEQIIVGSRGGPATVSGIFGTAASVVDHVADPNVPGIPNRADRKK